MTHYAALIIGAGFAGAVLAERIASTHDRPALVVDRRPHVGGNAYDELDSHGILVHRHGPHIFHTNSERIFAYLSRFTTWRPYEQRALGFVDDQLVPIPFNLTSFEMVFGEREGRRLARILTDAFGLEVKVPILKLRESNNADIRRIADFLYEKVFLHYTQKQWDRPPEALDASVTARFPIRLSRDDRYFQDRFQVMPVEGYTPLFHRLLDHPKIELVLETDGLRLIDSLRFDQLIYTGPVDAFFDYAHGTLPYRSVDFRLEHHDVDWCQEVATLNFSTPPEQHPWTRVTEFKHLTGQTHPGTTLVHEHPVGYVPGENEPYYPIPAPDSTRVYELYRRELERLGPNVHFAGRLADYRYYNMDQAVGRALSLFERIVSDGREVAAV